MSRQPLSITLPHELARTFTQEIHAELSTDSGVQLGFQLANSELCAMGRQPLSVTLPQELARTFIQEIHADLSTDSGVQLGFHPAEPELCAMDRQPLSITLPQELARTFIREIQAVLDGDASYFHAELWTDSGLQVGLHLSGPDDVPEEGGPFHE